MVVLPALDNIAAYLSTLLDPEGNCIVATFESPVTCESPRGRAMDAQLAILADFPWSISHFFKRAAAIRLTGIPLLRFEEGSTTVRPQRASCWEVSEMWISKMDLEETFLEEYMTAAEEAGMEEPEMIADQVQQPAQDQVDIVQQL